MGASQAGGRRRRGQRVALRGIESQSSESLNDTHWSGATDWAPRDVDSRQPPDPLLDGFLGAGRQWRRGTAAEQLPTPGQLLGPLAVGQEAIMAHAPEARGQDVQQKAAAE